MFSRSKIAALLALVLSLGLGAVMGRNGVRYSERTRDKSLVSNSVDSSITPGQDRSQQDKQAKPSPTPPSKDDEVTLPGDDVLRVDTELTNVLFSAVDQQKRFVTTLKKEDIRILEDGQPQEIFTFARQTELPLSLAILVDCSISEERTLPAEKDAAAAFVDSVLRPNKDEAAVLTFTGEATLELGLTGSVSRVRRALDKIQFVPPSGYIGGGTVAGTPPISDQGQRIAGSTAIWDAIWVTSDEVLSGTSDKTRRAIILLTDGDDTSSQKKLEDAIQAALKADTVVYSIGIGDSFNFGVKDGILRKISERTGGRAFFPRNEEDLRVAFAQIQTELRSQYLIAYAPTNKVRDNSFRKIQIDLANPDLQRQKMKLSYRQGYFAKGSSSGNGQRNSRP
jgi:Ca-activated chloride channel family protein